MRRRRLAKLSAPGDLDDSWRACFLDSGLAAVLRTWRDQPAARGAVLALLVEGGQDCLPTRHLQKFLWPVVAKGLLSAAPGSSGGGPGEVLAARLQLGRGRGAGDDAAFLLQTFGLKPEVVPIMFFLWGSSTVRVARLSKGVDAGTFRQVVAEAREAARQDLATQGSAQPAQESHRQMAEGLSAALSNALARDLVSRGLAAPGDFVAEDVAVGLDADAAAAEASAEHLLEREERAALRAAQAAELAESEAADRRRREEEERLRAEAERLEEEREAAQIWAEVERAVRLERLPAEPAEGEAGAVLLTVVLSGSARRAQRRWRATDRVAAVADFAFASASEAELPHAAGPPRLVCSFPRRELQPTDGRTLAEAGLAHREVLHAVPCGAAAEGG